MQKYGVILWNVIQSIAELAIFCLIYAKINMIHKK